MGNHYVASQNPKILKNQDVFKIIKKLVTQESTRHQEVQTKKQKKHNL